MNNTKIFNLYECRKCKGHYTARHIAKITGMTETSIRRAALLGLVFKKEYMVSEYPLSEVELEKMPKAKEVTLKEQLEMCEERQRRIKEDKPKYEPMPLSGSHGFVWRESPRVKRG